MSDLRAFLERGVAGFEPSEDEALGRALQRATRRRRNQRLGAALLAFALTTGAFGGVWLALGRRPAERPAKPTGHPVTVSAEAPTYPLRCSATLSTSVARPGESVSLKFTLMNLGTKTINYAFVLQGTRALVLDRRGEILFDPAVATSSIGPAPTSRTLAPGAAAHLDGPPIVVQWPGPLMVRPVCDAQAKTGRPGGEYGIRIPPLPAIGLTVGAAGPAPDPADALDRALARTGGLFDRCRPTPSGTPVVGTVVPPDNNPGVPAMTARCWAEIHRYPGFATVRVLFVAPADAPPVRVGRYIVGTPLPGTTVEVAGWTFVVTRSAVREAEGPTQTFWSPGRPGRRIADYRFEGGVWSLVEITLGCVNGASGEGIVFVLPGGCSRGP